MDKLEQIGSLYVQLEGISKVIDDLETVKREAKVRLNSKLAEDPVQEGYLTEVGQLVLELEEAKVQLDKVYHRYTSANQELKALIGDK